MKLQINNDVYAVDSEPLQAKVMEGIKHLIGDKSNDHPMLRTAVKAACTMGMGVLGLVKQDRNDDPIEIVLSHVAALVFNAMEEHGLILEGVKHEPELLEAGESHAD